MEFPDDVAPDAEPPDDAVAPPVDVPVLDPLVLDPVAPDPEALELAVLALTALRYAASSPVAAFCSFETAVSSASTVCSAVRHSVASELSVVDTVAVGVTVAEGSGVALAVAAGVVVDSDVVGAGVGDGVADSAGGEGAELSVVAAAVVAVAVSLAEAAVLAHAEGVLLAHPEVAAARSTAAVDSATSACIWLRWTCRASAASRLLAPRLAADPAEPEDPVEPADPTDPDARDELDEPDEELVPLWPPPVDDDKPADDDPVDDELVDDELVDVEPDARVVLSCWRVSAAVARVAFAEATSVSNVDVSSVASCWPTFTVSPAATITFATVPETGNETVADDFGSIVPVARNSWLVPCTAATAVR